MSMMRVALQRLFLKVQAVVLLAFGRRQNAADKFERMLRLQPTDGYALASHAHVQVQLGNFEAAIKSLLQLTGVRPQDASAGSTWRMCCSRQAAMTRPNLHSEKRWRLMPAWTGPGTAWHWS